MNKRHPKSWNEIKTNDSWSIFKIMGEFVNGYEKMSQIGPSISIFGSYIKTFFNVSGCDSIHTLYVTVNSSVIDTTYVNSCICSLF